MSEAAGVGRKMRAKHTVLTHFSQRYAGPSTSLSSSNTRGINTSSKGDSSDSSGTNANPLPPPRQPLTLAVDLLSFSFPSHMKLLPAITEEITRRLSAQVKPKNTNENDVNIDDKIESQQTRKDGNEIDIDGV